MVRIALLLDLVLDHVDLRRRDAMTRQRQSRCRGGSAPAIESAISRLGEAAHFGDHAGELLAGRCQTLLAICG